MLTKHSTTEVYYQPQHPFKYGIIFYFFKGHKGFKFKISKGWLLSSTLRHLEKRLNAGALGIPLLNGCGLNICGIWHQFCLSPNPYTYSVFQLLKLYPYQIKSSLFFRLAFTFVISFMLLRFLQDSSLLVQSLFLCLQNPAQQCSSRAPPDTPHRTSGFFYSPRAPV